MFVQLQARLHELVTIAVRQHVANGGNPHPHTVEATRQITGGFFADSMGMFPGTPNPHLLDEPYMSTPGAAGLLSQTLADIASGVDKEAEAQGTLQSAEFQAFHALVQSVYVGSLQKRAEHVEESRREVAGDGSRMPGTTTSGTPTRAVRRHGRGNTDSNTDGSNNNDQTEIAITNHESCSGDIAQALVAVAKGEGFERFPRA